MKYEENDIVELQCGCIIKMLSNRKGSLYPDLYNDIHRIKRCTQTKRTCHSLGNSFFIHRVLRKLSLKEATVQLL